MDVSMLRQKLVAERDLDICFLAPGLLESVLQRRMALHSTTQVSNYIRVLDQDPDECQALISDLLPQPSWFLEDDALTALLENTILPSTMDAKQPGDKLRIWIPQCGDGYLAYDVALLLSRVAGQKLSSYSAKVLATDPDPSKVNAARLQRFPDERFAKLREAGWPVAQVGRGLRFPAEVRGLISFGEHDPLRQPAFQRMDLVLCPGYLPLLDRSEREKVKSRFVRSLVKGGSLVLGRGEDIGFGAEPLADGQPIQAFVKRFAHPYEKKLGDAGERLPGSWQEGFIDRTHLPAMVIDPEGRLVHYNESASRQFGSDVEVGGLIARLDPPELFLLVLEAAGRAWRLGKAVPIENVGNWVGAVAPLAADDIPETDTVVVLVPLAPTQALDGCDPIFVDRTELAMAAAETTAADWRRRQEIHRTGEQASAITEGLYVRSEQLYSIKEELENRNAELQVTNAELKQAIQEREKAQEELRHRAEEFRALAENSPDYIVRVDRQLRIVYVNRAFLKAAGFHRDELVGRDHRDVSMMEPLATRLQEAVTRVFQKGREQSTEFDYPTPEGSLYFHARLVPEFAADGSVETVLAVARDITARKKAEDLALERAVEAEEGRSVLHALMDYIPEGVAIADAPDGKIVLRSTYGESMAGGPDRAGRPPEDALKDFPLFHADGVTPAAIEEMPGMRALTRGEVVTGEEWVYQRPDGGQTPVLITAGPIRDTAGNITGSVISWREIQAIISTREALRESLHRESHIADTLQQALLPPVPETIGGLDLAVKYQAAFQEAEVGGDFYHGAALPHNRFFLLLGDVSGKGLDAAVYGYMAKYMALGFISETQAPDVVLMRLNEALATYPTEGRFVTVLYLLIDLKTNTALYANGGHQPMLLYSASTGHVRLLPPTGRALGILPDSKYRTEAVAIEPGDMLFLYTDGLSDAGPTNSPLETDGLGKLLRNHRGRTPQTILESIYKKATRISGGKLRDDAASLLVRRER